MTTGLRPRAFAFLSLILLMLSGTSTAAQDIDPRRYLPDRADEDWTFLKTAPKVDVWDPVKYVPLGPDDWFVTLSGEVRFRPEGFRVRSSGNIDNYLLQRYLFGADVRLGPRARVFAEVQSGVINGALRSPRPTDRDTVDLHQAFVEWRHAGGKPNGLGLALKVGRQELSIGSSRLISASPGLNVKRSFDGATIAYRGASWTVGGATARLVGLAPGAFDDWSHSGQWFWAVAAGRRHARVLPAEVGAYYLGLDRSQSAYFQGVAPERRHTIGVKWSGVGNGIDLNYDALVQWGEFGDASIRAWAFATETGYRVRSAPWRPRISVRADFASGDRDPSDAWLQSFNPLFPGNAYSGAVGLLGPTNLTDFTAGLTVTPRVGLTLGFETPSYWRTSTSDGVYATDLRLLIPPTTGDGKYVGTNPGVLAVWQATRHWQFQGVITRFLSGAFLERTVFSSGFGFYSGSAVYRF
jgi:hypothetical protein